MPTRVFAQENKAAPTSPAPSEPGDGGFSEPGTAEDRVREELLALPPVVGRLAGLPAEALEPLSCPGCSALLKNRSEQLATLSKARQELVDLIEARLTDFEAVERRLLLKVKRDAFNGRPIDRHRGKTGWDEVLHLRPRLAQGILDLEDQVARLDERAGALYARQFETERRHVASYYSDPRFARGIALGTLGLVEKLRSRVPDLLDADDLGPPQKWEASLLRFVVRAAAKLSANSTLTAYALGGVVDRPAAGDLRFHPATLRERSLVRADRPAIEQVLTLLFHHPAVRERSLLAWNDTVEEVGEGQFRFIRDAHWQLSENKSQFEYASAARITAKIAPDGVATVRAALDSGPKVYGDLVSSLSRQGIDPAGAEEINGFLAHLADIGFVLQTPPWSTQEDRSEQRLAELLESLGAHDDLAPVTDGLREVRRLQRQFAESGRPELTVTELHASFGAFARAAEAASAPPTALPEPAPTSRLEIQPHFYEDVLAEPASLRPDDTVFHVSRSTVDSLFRSLDASARFASFFNTRHDALLTLAGWWTHYEPSRAELPLVDVVRGFADIWRGYLPFVRTAGESVMNMFDPLALDSLAQLRERRLELLKGSARLVRSRDDKSSVAVEDLERLVLEVPERYCSPLGASAFVQPTDGNGGGWVLNEIYEGTGRYLSRFTPALDGGRRRRFLKHLIDRSSFEVDGERAEFLQVIAPKSGLACTHPIQAKRVLGFRGLHLDIAQDRRVELADLRIRADLEQQRFTLVDREGRRLIPVHLSSMRDTGLSAMLRFVLLFG
ncbi:MAG: hypothetical protein AAFY88_10300, partial [Acidobacteriota bacterium]